MRHLRSRVEVRALKNICYIKKYLLWKNIFVSFVSLSLLLPRWTESIEVQCQFASLLQQIPSLTKLNKFQMRMPRLPRRDNCWTDRGGQNVNGTHLQVNCWDIKCYDHIPHLWFITTSQNWKDKDDDIVCTHIVEWEGSIEGSLLDQATDPNLG